MSKYEKVHLFRDNDFEIVTKDKIDEIVKETKLIENATVFPTLSQRQKMTEILIDFIREKKRIVYGGYAIHKFVARKNKEDGIYDFDNESPDIEFYSPDAVIDARDLCDLFYRKGYKFVRGSEAFHAETYKVYVELFGLCDITYMPKNIYQKVPTVTMDDLRYAHPSFLLVDAMRILTDPIQSYFRLEKAFPRIYHLQKHYPWEVESSKIQRSTLPEPENPLLRAMIKELTEGPEDVILIGEYAKRIFKKWPTRPDSRPDSTLEMNNFDSTLDEVFVGHGTLEVVALNFEGTLRRLYDALKDRKDALDGEKLEYTEYQRFFDYCGRRGVLSINGRWVVVVYHSTNRCVPVLPDRWSLGKTFKVASFSVVSLYFLIAKFIARSSSMNTQDERFMDFQFAELQKMRADYLKSEDKTILDDHVYREFVTRCLGGSVSALRAHKEDTEYRRAHIKQYGMPYFSYEPKAVVKESSDENIQFRQYKYGNTSGNEIKNREDYYFHPLGKKEKIPRESTNSRHSRGENGDSRRENGDSRREPQPNDKLVLHDRNHVLHDRNLAEELNDGDGFDGYQTLVP